MPDTISFRAIIKRFAKQGEKTGWTYVEIPAALAEQLNGQDKTSFRVKGKADAMVLKAVSLLPMGNGDYILPLNADMRKVIRKPVGETIMLVLSKDEAGYQLAEDFVACLDDDPEAKTFFETLTGSHQRYFSKWIESAKTTPTREKRIAQAINALARGWGYPEMIRAGKEK
jgi:hypothetical protein